MWGQEPLAPDPQDVYDEGHWTADGGAMGSQVKGEKGSGGGKGESAQSGVAGNGGGASNSGCSQGELPEATKRLRSVPAGKLLGIDQAVHLSIDCASKLQI